MEGRAFIEIPYWPWRQAVDFEDPWHNSLENETEEGDIDWLDHGHAYDLTQTAYRVRRIVNIDLFTGDDMDKIEKAVCKTLNWLADYQCVCTLDECNAKEKELDGVVIPIMMKVYQTAQAAVESIEQV